MITMEKMKTLVLKINATQSFTGSTYNNQDMEATQVSQRQNG